MHSNLYQPILISLPGASGGVARARGRVAHQPAFPRGGEGAHQRAGFRVSRDDGAWQQREEREERRRG